MKTILSFVFSSTSFVHSHFWLIPGKSSALAHLRSTCELSFTFETQMWGQGSEEVICSFRRIQRGFTRDWQFLIYTFSPHSTFLISPVHGGTLASAYTSPMETFLKGYVHSFPPHIFYKLHFTQIYPAGGNLIMTFQQLFCCRQTLNNT